MIKTKTKAILRILSVVLIIFSILAKPFMMPSMFWSIDKVYADKEESGWKATPDQWESNQNEKNFVEFLETINKAMYIALWPLLAVAWASMNNDLVYGKVFHLDTALWWFWQMMRNFSNYAIWFIFIATILMYFFKLKDDESKIKAFLPKLLIWWVLVQASWFLMWALVDLSTIMTYAFGALPLKVIAWSDLGNSPVLMPKVEIDLWDGQQLSGKVLNVTTYDAGGGKNYPACEYKDWKFKRMKSSWSTDWTYTEYCVYTHPAFGTAILVKEWSSKEEVDKDSKAKEKSDFILKGSWALTLQDLIKKWKWMIWVMYTLYTSLLNMASLNVSSSNQSTNSAWFEFMIKVFVAFALIVPLFAFAIVLVIRIVVMWLFIWFSPIIVLANVFDMKWLKGSWKMADNTNISSVLGMIFLPVVAVFAMSISLIFMTALINWPKKTVSGTDSAWVAGALGFKIEESSNNKSCVSIVWIWNKICITSPKTNVSASVFFNMISWLIVNMFGIALMRTVVFTALKSAKVTAWVVDKIEKFATWMAKSVPIFPVAGGVSVWALEQTAWYIRNLPDKFQSENFSRTLQPKLQNLFDSQKGWWSWWWSGVGGSGDGNKTAKAVQANSWGLDKNKQSVIDAFKQSHNGKDNVKNTEELLKDWDFRRDLVNGKVNIPDELDKAYQNDQKKWHTEFLEWVKGSWPKEFTSVDGHHNYYVKDDQVVYSFKEGKLQQVVPYRTVWLDQGELNSFNKFLEGITSSEAQKMWIRVWAEEYSIKWNTAKKFKAEEKDGKLQIK